jgi:uncharacterized membrane-anchored protein YitT (DUF2179 family)
MPYYLTGAALYALALYTFAKNAHFSPGGVSGIALIVNYYTGWPIGALSLIFNIPMVLICLRFIGRRFLAQSVCSMVICAFFMDVIFPRLPAYSGSPLLASMFTGVSLGAGMALIYMCGSSTGGMDFVVAALKKRHPHFSMGQITFVSDAAVILAGGLVFGSADAVLYGIIAVFSSTLVMDRILYGAGSARMAIIVTTGGQRIADAISADVERGSTLLKATGAYTGMERDLLLCVCAKNEIVRVRNTARAIDPGSMIMIAEASEVVGEGFEPPRLPGA